jgi:hypothetical protein
MVILQEYKKDNSFKYGSFTIKQNLQATSNTTTLYMGLQLSYNVNPSATLPVPEIAKVISLIKQQEYCC